MKQGLNQAEKLADQTCFTMILLFKFEFEINVPCVETQMFVRENISRGTNDQGTVKKKEKTTSDTI